MNINIYILKWVIMNIYILLGFGLVSQRTFKFLLKILFRLVVVSNEKISIFRVKNKPILGGVIHLLIVTLRPNRAINPHCACD